ncbi:GNAT family N-acetyltransferase [Streptomyces sp. CB03238]|uniref:GNAT family N-acetyltransferase n=1 Tax=Streptomyces sp. CB03238 TaxID=1907777 RepID=UPI000A10226C|nr:GNAT family N-acetyltransferase [Streptomyces sp. CB03238]ORT61639.1 GNAT family N-acetyltransferase [Streptomyces sp. CB03238]
MVIRECRDHDVELLDRHIPSPGAPSPGVLSSHARRYARQAAGDGTFLVAWRDGRPVGTCEVRWDGCAAPEVRAVCGEDCPEINGLVVWPESLRSHGIGTALVHAAEERARERGRARIGLGVEGGNRRAAALYARLGYRPVVPYTDRWSYEDAEGTVHRMADACTFLVKALTPGT